MKSLLNISILRSFTTNRIINIVKIWISYFISIILKKTIVWGYPYIITVEPANICNLQCPQCIVGSKKLKRPAGKMTFTEFKNIIDQTQNSVCYLVLFNQGEPFLNRELFNFIRYANQKKIYTVTSTNGHFLNNIEIARQVVLSGLNTLIISLDGADEATYNKYRVKGNFQRVIQGIIRIVELKKQYNRKTPNIIIQFLIMKHNEHQILAIKKLGKKLGVNKVVFKTVQVESIDEANNLLPVNQNLSRYNYEDDKLVLKNKSNKACSRIWTSTTILCDGSVVPCCFDKNGELSFSKISKKNQFHNIWRSNNYDKFRNNIVTRGKIYHICQNCTQDQKVYI